MKRLSREISKIHVSEGTKTIKKNNKPKKKKKKKKKGVG